MLFSFFKHLNAETLAANENVMVEKGSKVFVNVDIHEVNKTRPWKWLNFFSQQFFINTDSYLEGNVFKRYQMDIKCFLAKGTDVVYKDSDRLTLSSNVDITTTELEVLFKNNIKNGAYGKIVQSTRTAENVDTKGDNKLKSGEILFTKMPAETVYRLKNNFLLLPEDDNISIFQNLFYLANDKKLTTLNLKFKTENELKNFKTNEKYMGTIIDLDWFKHLADKGFNYAKKQYDLEFSVEKQGNVILKGKVEATPSTNAAVVEKTSEKTTETEGKKKMGTGLKVFLWLFFIALAGIAAYGAYFLIQRRKKAQMIEEQV
ncbi:hypothetical protein EHP00_763 [Ecytonucleospora hepatopenaei]|uniref:Uncharacterized protein n=1 Tax=Ecytonucleospora hepatopenaei TaxID=646526 RepID=A0A1W0E3D3_9MICR|nr:hypothetical protein EHP00_763 [Ecytonucleospora hepatopenaei]